LGYSNPEFDKLIGEEQKTYDRKKRAAILRQAGKILMEDAPFVPLFNLADLYGVARNVIWKPPPDEKVLVADIKIR
jgi:ABC-type transport system substrate-binding protein